MTIRVLGAGPSGLTAAITLARAGRDVVVFEKRKDVGKRFHGDLQGLENWSDSEKTVLQELANYGIDINFDCDPLTKLLTTNGTTSRHSAFDPPLCYLVKRGSFDGTLDYGLKAQALSAGVAIEFNQTIPEAEADIVATGPISKEIFAVDKGIVFKTNAPDTNVFLVNDKAAYKGYSYLLITKGYGCLCTVLFERFKDLDDNFTVCRRMIEEAVPFDVIDPTPVSGVGCFSTQNIYQKGTSLYTGEAAGIQDLFWGFGIRTAIQSGALAARSIIEGFDYGQVARNFFEDKLKATLASRYIWELISFQDYRLVATPSKLGENTRNSLRLAQMYNFSVPLKLIYPFAIRRMRKRYPNLRI